MKNYNPNKTISLLTLSLFLSFPTVSFSQSSIPDYENLFLSLMGTELEELEGDSLNLDVKEPSIMSPDEFFQSIEDVKIKPTLLNKTFIPKVFSGYRHTLHRPFNVPPLEPLTGLGIVTAPDTVSVMIENITAQLADEIENPYQDFEADEQVLITEIKESDVSFPEVMNDNYIPGWLRDALITYRMQEDLAYNYMIDNPLRIEYSDWDLPVPPQLIEDDVTFTAYIRRLNLPEIDLEKAVIPESEIKKRYWLHKLNTALQFSQAFVSPNWYQGGNNYLSLLFNFNWNVQLNQVFHPNILFQSDFSYKLALSSNPKNNIHRYNISEDALQYNLNTGLKAFKNWFYSFNLLFKTQIFKNYEEDSNVRTASFLSPGDLNMGIGMSYSHKNKYKTFQYTLTISPLSYNLKTCITDKINHELYNISPNRKVKNEIGSNAEFNMLWNITSNVSYKTRLFLFTDYSYFLSDWENTFSFEINKFLSTQLYVHMRYDTSADKNTGWKSFMLREILSFGLSYTFSTKP